MISGVLEPSKRFWVSPFPSIVVLLLSSVCFSQLPSSRCESISDIQDCTLLTAGEPVQRVAFVDATPAAVPLDSAMLGSPQNMPSGAADKDPNPGASTMAPAAPETQGFHWRRSLMESFTFLVIEQAYVVHSDFGWVVIENGVPFNHYWRDYMHSLSTWVHSGWNDGDPNWYGYVGHPIQGALTGFIEIQNDPQGEKQEFSKTKAYWWSRLKAGLWNAAYSTQWNLGPLSEVTVEKYGTKSRGPWNYNGSYPCSHHCLTGVGQIDIVMTPLGGTGWLIGEDFLDKNIVRRVEGATDNRFLIDAARCALNPIRGGANILHGKHPWYRASRDVQGMSLFRDQRTVVSTIETPKAQAPDHGDVFFGYAHIGGVHCQSHFSEAVIGCDPLSAKISNLGGWRGSVEKKYLRYFGAVADFSGQYGSVSQNSFLFGLRGGASLGRFRPFAQALVGAVHAHETGSSPKSDTSFAAALGVGLDSRLMRLLSLRLQADEIEASSLGGKRHNPLLSTGFVLHF